MDEQQIQRQLKGVEAKIQKLEGRAPQSEGQEGCGVPERVAVIVYENGSPPTVHDRRGWCSEPVEEGSVKRAKGDSHMDEVQRHFHLGMVGGSGRSVRGLNKRRGRELDRTIDRAVSLVALYKERDALRSSLRYLVERPKVQAAEAKLEELLTFAKPGDSLTDSIYGEVTVVKPNRKTITIRTPSGYKEARPFSLLAPTPATFTLLRERQGKAAAQAEDQGDVEGR